MTEPSRPVVEDPVCQGRPPAPVSRHEEFGAAPPMPSPAPSPASPPPWVVVLNGAAGRRQGEALAGVIRDAVSAAGCQVLLDACPQADILVNNLGIFDPKPFAAIADDEWLRFFDINVMSGVRLTRHYLPAMKQRNWGRVVFISSESGICPPAEMVHYGMSKSAQLSVARGIAETCVGSGVTVNSVLPGPTRTEGVATFFARLAEEQGVSVEEAERAFFANARPTSIIKRLIDPAEVAAMVAYVCSPLSSATQGAALRVEGGVVRSMV